jgi:hypothetical protein
VEKAATGRQRDRRPMVAAHAVDGDANARQGWQHRELGRQWGHGEETQATDQAGRKNVVALPVRARVWQDSTVGDADRRRKRGYPAQNDEPSRGRPQQKCPAAQKRGWA